MVQHLKWHPTGDDSVSLSWTQPANTGGRGIQNYSICVEHSQVCDNCQDEQCFTTHNSSCTVTGLVAGVNYNFIARAMNCQGEGPPVSVGGSLNNPQNPLVLSVLLPVTSLLVIITIVVSIIVVIIWTRKKPVRVRQVTLILLPWHLKYIYFFFALCFFVYFQEQAAKVNPDEKCILLEGANK